MVLHGITACFWLVTRPDDLRDVGESLSNCCRGFRALQNLRQFPKAQGILWRNPDSVVIPFDTRAYQPKLDPSDSILSLSERLAKYGGGGTDCSLPIRTANADFSQRKFAGIVLVSDNESWVYQGRPYFYGVNGSTGVMTEWQQFVQNQVQLHGGDFDGPKLIGIDLQPAQTTQAPERSDILNVGGFSDAVFDVMAAFLKSDVGRFVKEIEAVTL